MSNKRYNTLLEFILAIIPTIACILFTIVIVIITIQIQFNFNSDGTKLIIIGTVVKETTRIVLTVMGITGFIALTIVDLLLVKASFSIKHEKWGWGIFLLIVGIFAILPFKMPLLIIGIILLLAGLVSVLKHFIYKNIY